MLRANHLIIITTVNCRHGSPPCCRSEHSWSRWTTPGGRTVEEGEMVDRIRRTRPVRRSQNLSALHLFIISLEEYNKINIDLTLIRLQLIYIVYCK